ncbi:hypothetical protein PHYBLDRAFT_154576 [Phycomyces blakesleeanus NRRL 1555(-)]|uniref:Crossover junction endonuclease MUS81 n=1 Tax=Phycomyces blakesleeanus (strain ATCC 8743b / DSM 1359 / FGSC 10004 / NBRC 33097 / NRRL 1555) TaxID=763407 RepID=A0A163B0P3_PHYB8|nr:hypothetical protein PHYBLDRAFT_154576 [Phycomyces blakesleeanus NRRL 1555(-)]OAD77591.1 hypothetical protein PHYBLDRAFT_154576 [Phycomyces blakesleeanus NRRL 1555(-)]|eukprot:XP_018295631.1 hypothetical protein PHYBLDRAFT_154576 [Phycomyces blakesleeanus NRRL 1555(-)]
MPPECGNPLLRDWIGEWMEKARGLQSKAYFTYKKAHDSLSKCPITFQHPSEALQLVGIGVGMVDKLEKKMIEHCKANGLPIPVRTKGKRRNPGTQEGSGTQQEESSQAAARKRPTRTYVPTYRSGAYAILLSLMDQRDNGQQQATKEQIIRCGEDYANASFDLAEPGKSYTAWNSIKTLMNKSYVWKQGSPARYMLTDQGVAMATQLRNAGIPEANFLNECRHDPSAKFSPGSYDIVLILDNREVKMRNNRDYIQEKLAQKGVRVITRALDLGDVVWIAQKRGSDSPGDWLFLDIIIERKRLDDLISSIKDGRFHEQKKRLKESGARKVMYVVEEYNKEEAVRFGLQAIQTAMAATQVIDGFYLKRTQSIDDTIDYLVCMTRVVEKMYANTTFYRIPEHVVSRENYLKLRADYAAEAASSASSAAGQQISLEYYTISYPLYNRLNSKYGASTLKELYGRMLRTMRGVSGDKATALSQVYQTPHALFEAFEAKKGDTKAAKMLARDATSNAFMRRKWGASLSKKLWETWGVK